MFIQKLVRNKSIVIIIFNRDGALKYLGDYILEEVNLNPDEMVISNL